MNDPHQAEHKACTETRKTTLDAALREISDLKRKLSDSIAREQEIERELEQTRAHADALAHGLKELLYVYNRLISHGVIETPVATLRYTAKKIAENALTAYRNREEGNE